MNRIILILILVLSGASPYVQAQKMATLKGKVTDKSTGEPLIGAGVYIKSLQKGTTSDNQGRYQLDLKSGTYEISVEYLGYETRTQQIALSRKETTLDMTLIPSSEQLEEVTVMGKSEAHQTHEKAMPVSVISMEDMKGIVGNISDVLSKTSGMQVRMSGGEGSSSRLSVRGLEGKRIGYFMDDLALNDNNEAIDINDIPIDFIERIEIYKGVVPARLGGSSIGGAVNFVMKEFPARYADASYSFGSFNTHKANFTFRRNKNGYKGSIGGYYTHADNDYRMELPLQEGRYINRDHDGYEKLTLGGTFVSTRWWFDEVEFEGIFITSKKEIQGIEYNIREAESHSKIGVFNNHIKKKDFLLEGLRLDMNNALTYSVYQFRDTASTRYDWDGTPYAPVSGYGGEINGYNSNNKTLTVFQRTNLDYVINAQHSLTLSSQYRFARGIPQDTLRDKIVGYQSAFNSKIHNWVAGLSYEFSTPNGKFTNMLTGRLYYYNMETRLIPDLGSDGYTPQLISNKKSDFGFSEALRYRFTPEWLVKASVSYDVRLPSEQELIGDGFLIEPAGNLNPEHNTSLNLGFMYDNNKSSNRFQLEVNAFAMYLKDMIRLTGGALQSKYENFGKMRTLGAELEVKWDATRWLYLWGNVTYQDLRDTRKYQPGSTVENPTKGDRVPNIPYLFANAGVELHRENFFGGKGQNTRLFADCSYVDEYLYDFEQSIYQERRIPRATTLNAGVEHSFCNRTIFVKFQMNNITGEQIFSEFNRPLPGRNFSVKLRYIWK
ncbi:TonB-dependent receptor [Parabacteroides distasonis]|uniref:TonB-dependent receptor n=1 Tax=Parabacteroides distasonis TaxID=823 RepID=UPI0036F3EE01